MPHILLGALFQLHASLVVGHAPSPVAELRREPTRVIAFPDSTPTTVGWKLLSSMDSRKGIVPDSLNALQGKQVRIPGFVVPLEDLNTQVKEILLVPYYGACVHSPPPPPNQMIYVQLPTNAKLKLFDVVWVEGMLEIIRIESPYGVVGYRMQGKKTTPYQQLP